jgi:LEA14-like dessication related protein
MSQLLDKAKNFIAEKVADMPKPEASITDVDFKGVSRESVEYLAKIDVSNPYSTSIPICEIKYSFKSANRFVFFSCSSSIFFLMDHLSIMN